MVGKTGLVQVVDTRNGAVLVRADTGGRATGVAVSPDGRRLYVVNGWTGAITVVDPSTGAILDRLFTQVQLSHAVMRPDGRRLYVSASGGVAVVNPETFQMVAVIKAGGQPQGLAVHPDNKILYVANSQDGTVGLVDTATAFQTATVQVGGLPQHLAISPDGKRLYVSSMRLGSSTPGTLSVIDTTTNQVAGTVDVGRGAGSIAVTPDGATVYLTLPKERSVLVVDAATMTVRERLRIDSPNVAIAPGDTRVFLATGATTTVLDSTNAVLTTFGMKVGELEARPRLFDAAMIAFPPGGQATPTGRRTSSSRSSTGSS
ncbi:40-residue YVTN family beta-propeller repeat-containing protein [Lentzea albidocapillata subsp. violacea]|uniref:40-residue YVTN family beta-propeller repeat-containing protein n=1 Tax=Lentzea albidocapillata subsp. violacea TaxID=128104 RepID=A0A1G9D5D9_9PSEU|nr:40-residue YVTN family beta-propeller repeat-containing protein [Lentzea albidocapillata subsp. violacea]